MAKWEKWRLLQQSEGSINAGSEPVGIRPSARRRMCSPPVGGTSLQGGVIHSAARRGQGKGDALNLEGVEPVEASCIDLTSVLEWKAWHWGSQYCQFSSWHRLEKLHWRACSFKGRGWISSFLQGDFWQLPGTSDTTVTVLASLFLWVPGSLELDRYTGQFCIGLWL